MDKKISLVNKNIEVNKSSPFDDKKIVKNDNDKTKNKEKNNSDKLLVDNKQKNLENKIKKNQQLIESIEKIYASIEQINQRLNNRKNSIDNEDAKTKNDQVKFLLNQQKKLFRQLNWKIKRLENSKIKDKYSSLPGDVIISLKNVNKYYSSNSFAHKVLKDINLDIYKGDFVVILGPSGSGKTSLMNLLSGIDKTTYGDVNVAGFKLQNMTSRNLTSFRKDVISYVFQRYGLLPNLTVNENVMMGNYLGKRTYSERILKESKLVNALTNLNDKEKCSKIIDMMGLTNQKEKYPYEMSGGQKQRVSIARAIAKNPLIIFGDEPTGAVDEEMSKTIIDSFVKINNELKTTIIIITHDEKISTFANRVIFVLDGKINKVVCKQKGVEL